MTRGDLTAESGSRCLAFSRPHDLLTKLGGPIPRRFQAHATRRYLDGVREFVALTDQHLGIHPHRRT